MVRPSIFLAAAAVAVPLAMTAAGAAQAADTSYPLSLDNCGREISFDSPPQRVVSLGQAGTEMLYALGLGDKVVGTAVWFNPVLDRFEKINQQVERLADNDPSFESVVAKRPELVTSQFEWHVGPQGIVGTREQFAELGISTYILPTDCVGKDNTTGGDGTRNVQVTTDLIHRTVGELARIFDVPEAGDEVIADLKTRERDARQQVERIELDQDVSAVVWFSSAEMDIDPYVAGQNGAPAYMLKQLGIRNVIDSNEEWPTVGWETIAQKNPTIIVIARMDRRRFPADDYKRKLEFLKTDPVTRHMDAVQQDRIVIMDAHAMQPTLRLVNGLETLADAVESYELSK
ncbi:ABC transporter substrate-binding protein [Rhodovibrio salinarum]|uniref:ABC transporter substrate-binding protein n=1 Tax=Rhodovibrio salinarum TaxID=1087 RepID=UPI0004AF77CD|nr:ABC transporter substrate-binding protein [Rhodovibrio salinarum]